jgi:hypothetical protein
MEAGEGGHVEVSAAYRAGVARRTKWVFIFVLVDRAKMAVAI